MSELLPSAQAREIRDGLLDYLTTTFALADPDARLALAEFLSDREHGMFKGPYLRLRLPFRAAVDGWQSILGWDIGLTPYGHQAEAFARLSSADLGPEKPRPLPTLVTTGTGSGKTEAFLYPILDHVLRARRDGVAGMKALILYPMNALANDQSKRLADLLTTRDELAGITAALYTGQEGPQRTKVSADGLITDRAIIRDEAPDILLTNYKMLDQLLLRYEDRTLWQQSAASLQYLVLDEFHTYDGAQGTDVAMLLRRLGLTLKSHLPDGALTDAERARPLGRVTPVATSATLGDQSDPAAMIGFARTVFGDDFEADSVVTESRLGLAEWTAGAADRVAALGLTPRRLARADLAGANAAVEVLPRAEARDRTFALLGALYDTKGSTLAEKVGDDAESLLALVRAHPQIQELVPTAEQAIHLGDLAAALFPEPASGPATGDEDDRITFLTHLVAALSHVRVVVGRAALGVDLHLWVRELTRIDRVASAAARYLWSDDGELTGIPATSPRSSTPSPPSTAGTAGGPAGVSASPLSGPTSTPTTPPSGATTPPGRVASAPCSTRRSRPTTPRWPGTGDQAGAGDSTVEGLRWLSIRQRMLLSSPPADDDPDYRDGWVLPVLTQVGPDADDESRDDTCPSCQQKDGIRFLGSAIATLLSVTLSTLFGDEALDPREKKALVFTDSVQDAAHRAGFVESRSHTLTLRALLRHAVGDHPVSLDALVDQAIAAAGDDRFRRYRIIPPDLVERRSSRRSGGGPVPARSPPGCGPGYAAGCCSTRCSSSACSPVSGAPWSRPAAPSSRLTPESLRRSPASPAPWLPRPRSRTPSTESWPPWPMTAWWHGCAACSNTCACRGPSSTSGSRPSSGMTGTVTHIWGGRPRGQGMPAFPRGRSAPAFPRIGPAAQVKDPLLDPVSTPQVLVRPVDRAGARRHRRPRRAPGAAVARPPRPRGHPAHGRDRDRRHRVHHPGERGRRQPDRPGGAA